LFISVAEISFALLTLWGLWHPLHDAFFAWILAEYWEMMSPWQSLQLVVRAFGLTAGWSLVMVSWQVVQPNLA
jgi:hypothetical protein